MSTSSVGITGETAQGLAQSAEQRAASPEGEAAGGQVGQTTGFQQELAPAVKAALQQYLQDHPNDPNVGELQQVLGG
jgi:hypothetical protein